MFAPSVHYPLPLSFSSAIAYLFPQHVQSFYDETLEPFFRRTAPALRSISTAAPTPLVTLVAFALDLTLLICFVVRCGLLLLGLKALATLTALTVVTKCVHAKRSSWASQRSLHL